MFLPRTFIILYFIFFSYNVYWTDITLKNNKNWYELKTLFEKEVIFNIFYSTKYVFAN